MTTTYKELETLNKNPMFRISLGSKELFHSNFLAFLWDQSQESFLKMIASLLPKGKKIDVKALLAKKPTLSHEKENFDICISHMEGNRDVIDIIIENKVKSIPYMEQLDKYMAKVKNQPDPICILLSLAEEFPDLDKIHKQEEWIVINYGELADAIKPDDYIGAENQDIRRYIEDYVSFIRQLDRIKDKLVLPDDFENEIFHSSEEIGAFHNIRLSDLYFKLRGSCFICLLKEEIEKRFGKSLQVEFFTGGDLNKRREGKKETKIWLMSGINRGKSTITICINPANSKNLYELQLEWNQYRHMFNQYGLVNRRNTCENQLLKMAYFDYENLPNQLKKKHGNWDGKSFNQYAPDCLYKYVRFDGKNTVKDLIKILLDDISKVLGYLSGCERIAKGL